MPDMTIAARELKTLVELSDPRREGESVDSVWQLALSTIKAVVPCDVVTFQIQDVGRRRVLAMREWDDRYQVDAEPDDADCESYWSQFWSSYCSYPQRSGDYFTVTRESDQGCTPVTDHAGRAARSASDSCAKVMVSLPPLGVLDYRIMLWRGVDLDFSDSEVLMLSLLRPHLVAIRDLTFDPSSEPGPGQFELTARQHQLLRLVARGLTNRQAARELGLSEHTVRKHVENIFERLQVSSRAAAVARAFPGGLSA